MLLIGKESPDFISHAVMPDNSIKDAFHFSDYVQNKKAVLFFYPLDFTFVCPSEIIALNNALDEFTMRDVRLMVVSVDSQFTHLAYKKTPVEAGGIGDIQIPMISDLTKKIAADYGVLSNSGVAFRGTFLIDANKIVRYQSINDLSLGRNVNEILRLIDALDHVEKNGEVCPVNWKKGDEAIVPTREGIGDYLEKNAFKL